MANSPARSVIDVGSVIADTYKIEALIGRGGMGAVFVASHNRLPGKKVAIKLLHAEVHDEDVMLRFRREAEIASRLGHPNICAVHDFNIMPDGTPYLVLDYLEGQTLAQKIKDGPIPLEQVLSIVRQVGSALAAAHREGIVHRDLKPQNIFLIPTEVDGRMVEIAKVLDFGISKIVGSQTVKTQESTLLGTPQYMAPEQATGQHNSVDQRTDVFALGSIVYEMLNGHPAFSGASIPEVVFKVVYEQPAPMSATVPTTIADAVKQAMAKPADDRFPSVSGFVEALTGMPLTNFRPSMVSIPDSGFATGSKRVSNPDALANTMGSGDYTPPPKAAVVPGSVVRGSSPTVESQSRPIDVGTAPTSLSGQVVPVPAKKPTAMILGLVLVAVAVAAVVGWMVVKTSSVDTTSDVTAGPEVAVATPADKALVAKATDPKAAALTSSATPTLPSSDVAAEVGSTASSNAGLAAGSNAGSAAGSNAGSAAGSAASKPTRPVPVKTDRPKKVGGGQTAAADPVGDDDPAGDETARDSLGRAEAALAAGNLADAARLALAVINSADAKLGQQAKAHAIRGAAACRKRDTEGASRELRQLRAPRLRQRIISACDQVGIELDQK